MKYYIPLCQGYTGVMAQEHWKALKSGGGHRGLTWLLYGNSYREVMKSGGHGPIPPGSYASLMAHKYYLQHHCLIEFTVQRTQYNLATLVHDHQTANCSKLTFKVLRYV